MRLVVGAGAIHPSAHYTIPNLFPSLSMSPKDDANTIVISGQKNVAMVTRVNVVHGLGIKIISSQLSSFGD